MRKLFFILFLFISIEGFSQNPSRQLFYLLNQTIADSTDALAFINAAGITNTTQKNAIYRLVNDLKGVENGSYNTTNIWSKFLAIYPFVGGTSSTCSYNLKNTAAYQLTFISSPTFSSAGYVGNTTSYMKTGIVPSTAMTINNTHLSLSVSSSIAAAGAISDIGCIGVTTTTQRLYINLRFTGDLYQSDQYSTTARISVTNSSSTAFFAASSRTSSSAFGSFRDGVSSGTHGPTGGSLPTVEIVIGGSNNNGTYNPLGVARTYNFASIGSGLTDAEVLNLYNAEHNFNITLSR